ncbi:MAG: hypothetical protein ACLTCI_06120 [[Clostridium] nexile]
MLVASADCDAVRKWETAVEGGFKKMRSEGLKIAICDDETFFF